MADKVQRLVEVPDSPECEKLVKVAPVSNKIGEFVDWLRDVKNISFARAHVHTPEVCDVEEEGASKGATCGVRKGEMLLVHARMESLLAEFFGIDLNKVEQERRALLEALRK